MLNLEAKVVAQRSVKDLEKKRSEKRMKLYQAQDEVDEKKETLLSMMLTRYACYLIAQIWHHYFFRKNILNKCFS